MKRMIRNKWLLVLYAAAFGILVWFDQFTKNLAVLRLKDQAPYPVISGVFELSYLENRGMAWGMLQGARVWFLLFGTVVCVLLLYGLLRTPDIRRFALLRISLMGLVAGAVGNMIDRGYNGFVVDFFYFRLIDFPVFNVADIYVVVCGILFVLAILFVYKDEELQLILPETKHKKEK